ncbi:MAG: hypothetical protein JJT94_07175 [Bernardetiaceae bacterium]|nr:hypothetical protein [Bernardetiaceae bacterium]
MAEELKKNEAKRNQITLIVYGIVALIIVIFVAKIFIDRPPLLQDALREEVLDKGFEEDSPAFQEKMKLDPAKIIEPKKMDTITGSAVGANGLMIAYILGFGAIVALIGLSIMNAVKKPKSMRSFGIGLGVVVVVFLIGYIMAGTEPPNDAIAEIYVKQGIDDSISKRIGGAINTMYILIALAVAGIVYTEISKAFK